MSKLFIFIGLVSLIITGYLIWQRNTPRRLAFDTKAVVISSEINTKRIPKILVMKELGIELPIIPSRIVRNNWEATTQGVSYLSSTAIPGQVGNSVLYGHNWQNLLGRLTRAKPGESLDIVFENGDRKEFIIEYTQVVSPEQTSIIQETADTRITLYTCTGFLDSKRFVVTALPKG